MNRRRAPSIEDVAREAGVSVATVSRALRGLPNVAESTRERVETVAVRLDYHANPSAARLATGRTRLVQIATPTVDGWYCSRVIAGTVDALLERGYEAVTRPVENPKQREEFLTELTSLEKRVDGLILVDLNIPEEAAAALHSVGLNLITVGFATRQFPSVVIDDFQVGYIATNHLIELGHRRIGLISGEPNHPLAFSVPGLRLAGYTAALAEHGIRVDPSLEQSGRFTAAGGRQAMEHLLALENPPTAVFAMSDEMAFGAWRAIVDGGLSWPDDVAVIGVDDHELAEMVDLSTIRLAPRRLGRAAARKLLALVDQAVPAEIDGDLGLGQIEVVARSSTVGTDRAGDRAV